MSSLILCFRLLCILDAWAVNLASSCKGLQFQSEEGRCCDPCDKGEYVADVCSENQMSTKCLPCEPGTYKDTISPLDCTSCLTCSNITLQQCTKTTNAKCSCSEGYMCSDEHCSKCEVKKTCQLGEKLERKGTMVFSYECEPCPDKTYSDTHDGICKSITQCRDSGFFAVFPGNKTHNARCSLYDAEVPYRWDSTIIVINLACSILLLLLLLYACVKKTMRHTHANGIAVFAPVSANTPDYPYPKEEIGEKFSICQL